MARNENEGNSERDLFSPAPATARAPKERRAGGGIGLECMNAVRGRVGNTAPANSKSDNWFETSEAASGSIAFFDWLRFSATASFTDWASLREDLEALRAEAEQRGEAVLTELGGQVVGVEGYGIGKGTCYRRYVLRVSGIVVSLPDDPDGRLWVEMSGDPLTNQGFGGCMQTVDRVISGLGATLLETQVSRVDIAADVLGRKAGEVFNMMHGETATKIGDAAKWSVHFEGTDVQTVTIGAKRADVICRCYDKLAELRDKPERLEQLQNRWGSKPENVLRVEFEVKRAKLAALKVETLPGLLGNLDRVLNLLTFEWLRFAPRDEDLDRTNTTRAGVDPLWREVRGTFETFVKKWEAGKPEHATAKPVPAKRMLAQAAGCVKRYLAMLGQVPEHPEGAIYDLAAFVSDDFARFIATLADKALDFGTPIQTGSTFYAAAPLQPVEAREVDDEASRAEWLNWWREGMAIQRAALGQ